MTLPTMQAVTEILIERGFDATFEYPGFVAVKAGTRTIHFGDAGDVWSGDIYEDLMDDPTGCIDTIVPRDSDSVPAIVAATVWAVAIVINRGDAHAAA